jgi:cell division protein FtsQ
MVTLIGLIVGGLYLVHSSLFSARHIEITGAIHTPRAKVLAASDLSSHPPLVDVNTSTDASAIERLPWVLQATVVRVWPDSIRISLIERTPIASAMLTNHKFALIDAKGRVLSIVDLRPGGVVALSGVGSVPSPGGYLSSRAQGIVATASALPIDLLSRVASIGQNALDGIVLHLIKGPVVVVSSATDLRQKMVSLATVLARTQLAGIVTIDLRVPSSPVLTR